MYDLGEIDLGIEGNSEEKKQSPKKKYSFFESASGVRHEKGVLVSISRGGRT